MKYGLLTIVFYSILNSSEVTYQLPQSYYEMHHFWNAYAKKTQHHLKIIAQNIPYRLSKLTRNSSLHIVVITPPLKASTIALYPNTEHRILKTVSKQIPMILIDDHHYCYGPSLFLAPSELPEGRVVCGDSLQKYQELEHSFKLFYQQSVPFLK